MWNGFIIKNRQIAINPADRPSRFTGGEKIDCAIAEIDLNKRKISLSMKLLEEIEKRKLLKNMELKVREKSSFSSLSEDLKKKIKKISNIITVKE